MTIPFHQVKVVYNLAPLKCKNIQNALNTELLHMLLQTNYVCAVHKTVGPKVLGIIQLSKHTSLLIHIPYQQALHQQQVLMLQQSQALMKPERLAKISLKSKTAPVEVAVVKAPKQMITNIHHSKLKDLKSCTQVEFSKLRLLSQLLNSKNGLKATSKKCRESLINLM